MLIDETEWTGLDVYVKAQAFEGLLKKQRARGKRCWSILHSTGLD